MCKGREQAIDKLKKFDERDFLLAQFAIRI